MLLGRDHPRNRKSAERFGLVGYGFDFKPNHRELVDKLVERLVRIEMLFEPRQREFHARGRLAFFVAPRAARRAVVLGFPPPWRGRDREGGVGKRSTLAAASVS